MGVLNFNTDNLITGVNIIDGILLWTDNVNEPRQIDIDKYKNGDHSSGVTVIDGREFLHEDVTVIKLHPYKGIELGLEEYEPTDLLPEPPFEEIFPRFSYRWRYDDGQYSPYAPFTEAAFLPKSRTDADATPAVTPVTVDMDNYTEGFNTTLFNNVGRITLRNIPRGGPNVVAVDLLYTESISSTIYILETLEVPELVRGNDFSITSGYEFGPPTEDDYTLQPLNYEVTARKIARALPANQLTRPFDNVPRRALGQEVTANRLIYANYTHQRDQPDVIKLETTTIPIESFPYLELDSDNQFLGKQFNPLDARSITARDQLRLNSRSDGLNIKSNRTYEIGVAYIDAYGRQGSLLAVGSDIDPVTGEVNVRSSFRVPFVQAERQALACRITSPPPPWAVSYRYFIKDTSQDFHSLISYNIYNEGRAVDDNSEHVWIEFQSTDRNKVQSVDQTDQGTVLVLRRNGDTIAPTKSRFLVQDIENEAPAEVRSQLAAFDVNTTVRRVGNISKSQFDTVTSPTTLTRPSSVSGNTYYLRDKNTGGSATSLLNSLISTFNQFINDNQPEADEIDLLELVSTGEPAIIADLSLAERPLLVQVVTSGGSFVGGEGALVQIISVESQHISGGDPDDHLITINFGNQYTLDLEDDTLTMLSTTGLPATVSTGSNGNDDPSFRLYTTQLSDEALERLQGRFWVRAARNGLTTVQSSFDSQGEIVTLQPHWFETEPIVAESQLDLYWETSDTYCVCTDHGWPNKLRWSNTISEYHTGITSGIYLDSQRTFNKFNSVQLVKGVRVNTPGNERYQEETRLNGLIFSGLYNSRTGINRLNEFIQADGITKEIEPNYGSIQKLHTRDTNLVVLAEDKVFNILADKDLLLTLTEEEMYLLLMQSSDKPLLISESTESEKHQSRSRHTGTKRGSQIQ